MALCVETLKKSHEWSEMQGVRSAGHILQLCINAVLKQEPICCTVAAACHLLGYFKKGHKSKNHAKTEAGAVNVPRHKLIQDVSTRWNSTFSKLERLLSNAGPLLQCCLNQPLPRRVNAVHWTLLQHTGMQ